MNRLPILDESRREELLTYLIENPEATTLDVEIKGYKGVLKKYFHGRLNEAKEVAGIPVRPAVGGYKNR